MPVITGTDENDFLAGTGEADVIRGLLGRDVLFGLAGDDQLEGGEGDDSLWGDRGDDRLYGGVGDDFLVESDGGENDSLYGEDGNDHLFYNTLASATPLDALLDGGAGDDEINYFSYFNTLNAATLIGGGGVDRIFAGGAFETDIDAGGDADFVEIIHYRTTYQIALGTGSDLLAVVSNQFFPSDGAPMVVSDFAVGDGGDSTSLVSFLAWQSSGWSFAANPFATGHLQLVQQGSDALIRFDPDGAAGVHALADFMLLQNVSIASLTARNLGGYASSGAASAGVTIDGGGAADVFGATSGNDLMRGFGGNDILYGAAGNDHIEGGEGDDRLDGELGDDELHGGAGNDILLDKLAGGDKLYGEGGNDSLYVDRQWFVVPSVTVLIDGGEGSDQLRFMGRQLQDDVTVIGGAGNDHINVYLGREVTIDAGDGDDFVDIDVGIGHAVITLGAGSDTLALSMYIAPVVGFTVTDFQAGNGGDDLYLLPILQRLVNGWDMTTNPFAEGFLRVSRDGADTVLLYDPTGDATYFSVLGRFIGVGAGQLTAFNFGFEPGPVAIVGTDGADNLAGAAAAEELIGQAGNDVLNGGGGADVLRGGVGNDLYFVDNAGDVVAEAAGEGFDQVYALASYALTAGSSVEVLGLADAGATAALNLTGNALAQQIFGNAGANALTGGGGQDALYGGAGDDVYFVEGDDYLVEAANGGFDQAYSSTGITLTAGAAIEVLSVNDYASTNALTIIGNEYGQQIFGNAGANILVSGGGQDALYGNNGDDIYLIEGDDFLVEAANGGFDQAYSSTNITLTAGAAIEILGAANAASTAALNLTGNALGQQIFGNAGANVLNGGGGIDALYGLGGSDAFLFSLAPGGGNFTFLADFSAADDTILLDHNAFTGLAAGGGLDPNVFVTGTAAQDINDRIIYDSASGALYYDADGNGTGAAIQFATLTAHPAITASDFQVI